MCANNVQDITGSLLASNDVVRLRVVASRWNECEIRFPWTRLLHTAET